MEVVSFIIFFIIIIVILGILVFIGRHIWLVVQRRKNNEYLESMLSQQQAFLQQHPDAVKVYFYAKKKSQMLDVSKVNGAVPERFVEGRQQGIFLLPGKRYDLDLLCEERRRKERNVYTAAMQLTPKPRTTYTLKLDDETKHFSIS